MGSGYLLTGCRGRRPRKQVSGKSVSRRSGGGGGSSDSQRGGGEGGRGRGDSGGQRWAAAGGCSLAHVTWAGHKHKGKGGGSLGWDARALISDAITDGHVQAPLLEPAHSCIPPSPRPLPRRLQYTVLYACVSVCIGQYYDMQISHHRLLRTYTYPLAAASIPPALVGVHAHARTHTHTFTRSHSALTGPPKPA